MKYLVISNISEGYFEGNKNVAMHLENYLLQKGNVEHFNLKRDTFNLKFFMRLKHKNPNQIHIIFRLSKKLILYFIILRIFCRNVKIIYWSLQPPLIDYVPKYRYRFFPNRVLVLSEETKIKFKNSFWPTSLAKVGINKKKFNSKYITVSEINTIRDKYNIPSDKKWVLHVGPIKQSRNVLALKGIPNNNTHLTIISRPDKAQSNSIRNTLQESNIQIIDYYIDDIEKIYSSIDLYVFPTFSTSGCIETPLSVLEALSCGSTVVSRNFGSLKNFNHKNLIKAENDKELVDLIHYTFKKRQLKKRVKNFSQILGWEEVFKYNEQLYKNL